MMMFTIPNDLVLSLYNSYLNDMDKISCLRASVITFKNDGTVAPYNEWLTSKYTGDLNIDVFPVGVGGVLYPPNSLHKDVLSRRFIYDIMSCRQMICGFG